MRCPVWSRRIKACWLECSTWRLRSGGVRRAGKVLILYAFVCVVVRVLAELEVVCVCD